MKETEAWLKWLGIKAIAPNGIKAIAPNEYNRLLDRIGFPFEVTALLEFNEQPYAFIIFLGEGCTVSFLDELGRTYMSYRFEPSP